MGVDRNNRAIGSFQTFFPKTLADKLSNLVLGRWTPLATFDPPFSPLTKGGSEFLSTAPRSDETPG